MNVALAWQRRHPTVRLRTVESAEPPADLLGQTAGGIDDVIVESAEHAFGACGRRSCYGLRGVEPTSGFSLNGTEVHSANCECTTKVTTILIRVPSLVTQLAPLHSAALVRRRGRVPRRREPFRPELAAAFDMIGFSYYATMGAKSGGAIDLFSRRRRLGARLRHLR